MELTRVELDKIMRKKFKNYDMLCSGEDNACIQECITFFIAGYEYALSTKGEIQGGKK